MFIRVCGGRKKSEKFVSTKGTISVTTNITGAAVEILDGAKVVATGSTMSGYTYTTEKIKYGTYVVTVKKDGYKDFTQTVVLNADDAKVDAKLISVDEVEAELKDAYKVNDTQVQVNFTNKIAVPTKDNFSIEGLTITDAKITDDQKSVILTVDGMETDKTYTVKTKNIVDVNGKTVADGTVEFIARKISYKVDMKIVDVNDVNNEKTLTEIKSDGKATAKVVVTLLDDAGNVIKDNAEVRFTTTAGNFAETKVAAQSGVASNVFTSEISTAPKDALITVTVVASDNKDLINLDTKRTLRMSPVIDTTENISLTDVMVETCDRVVLFFDKDVDVTKYTKNSSTHKYAYDSSKMEIRIADNAGTKETVAAVANEDPNKVYEPIALAPVPGESKALYAILDVDEKRDSNGALTNAGEGKYLTDNSKAIVEIKDKTRAVPATESKSAFVTDVRNPAMLSVTNVGLKKLKITFSEPIQNSINSDKNSAEKLEKWIIDHAGLDDEKYGVSYGEGELAKAEVGTFNDNTLEDTRNVVTITLGKDKDGVQKYFTAGSHSVEGNKIGDWANVTDTNAKNNLINSQSIDFVIEDDKTAPTATVKVESPEQFDVKFNTPVSEKELKAELKLQQYKDNAWADVKDAISVRPVKGTEDEYIVELTKDWTKILNTKETKKNYYNYNFRLFIKKGVVTNVLNGLKNEDIELDLNDKIMKEPDVTSTEMTKVTRVDGEDAVLIDMSEPVQIAVDGNRTLTPKEEQGDKLSEPIVQFISSGDKETIQGRIVEINDHDNQIKVVPDSTVSTGTWKVVVRNVSDDVGNTSPTLVDPNFVVDKPIVSDGFKVLWVVAVKGGKESGTVNDVAIDNPITPEKEYTGSKVGTVTYPEDVIYVKFNKKIKWFGNTANAGSSINYTINGNTLPTDSMIDASVKGYNENAVTKNSYSDLIAINVKDALNDGSNIINISEALESATGEQLSNGGRKLLTKTNRFYEVDKTTTANNVFVWNYDECNAGVIKANENKISVANLQKFFDNGEYGEYDLADLDITDAADKTITLKHTSPVNFAKANNDKRSIDKLNINTQETGRLVISNVSANEITIDAPNADVVFKNVDAKTVNLKDVVDGSLVLDGNVNAGDGNGIGGNKISIDNLNVTDDNAGAIEVKNYDTSSTNIKVTNTTIDTNGKITLKLDGTVDSNDVFINPILVKKECTLNVQNATGNNAVVVTIDKDVKLADMKINAIVATDSDDPALTINVYENGAATTTQYTGAQAVEKKYVTKEVQGAKLLYDGSKKVDGKAKQDADYAKTTVDISVDSAVAVGKIKIQLVDEKDKAISYTVDISDTLAAENDIDKVGAEIAKKQPAGYKVSYAVNKLTFTSSTAGEGHTFNVLFDGGTTTVNGTIGTPEDGKDYIAAATKGTNEFTVTQGSAIAGTIKVTINGTEITVNDIKAGDSASTIAGKIEKAINSNESIGKDSTDADKKVEAVAVGSTVKITTANAGANKVVDISVAPKFTAN